MVIHGARIMTSLFLQTVLTALWLMLPAYIANASAAFFGGKTPIDRGRCWGKSRLLGEGKTWEGFLKGFSCGFLIGLLQQLIAIKTPGMLSFGHFPLFLVTLGCLAAGAMLGDLLGSFLKRRVGIPRGAPFPVVDQLDFVAGAWLLLAIFARDWFIESFSWPIILAVLLMTPLLHLLTNYLGFKIGRKQVPW
jgi:CDP-2,3-bis-(O-geranylgeranyl)-sn-glycerol synthase